MEQKYSQSYIPTDRKSAEQFKSFLLKSDTLIIPVSGDLVCSPSVLQKLHDNVNSVQNKLFYQTEDNTLYLIYSRYYEGIGEVKIFFEMTEYIQSQIVIIKISLIIMFLSFFIAYFIGRIISQKSLQNITRISQKLHNLNLDEKLPVISSVGPQDDEIEILVQTLNKSFGKIEKQTHNLKQFITDVSHEFKTPLMSINSKIDVLQKKHDTVSKLSTQEEQDFFSYIKEKTYKLNSLLEMLFLFSRFEENIQKFTKTEVNFSDYLDKKIDTFFENYPQVTLKKEISPDIHLSIEDTTCNIIIENLFTNAVKFADSKNPIIKIGCDEKSFWVIDNGKGIKKEEIEKITQKFYKSDRNKQWFWIGLFLVQRIVNLYGLKLCFSSPLWKWTKVEVIFW